MRHSQGWWPLSANNLLVMRLVCTFDNRHVTCTMAKAGGVLGCAGLTVEESVAASTVTTTFGRGRVYRICMQFMPESEYPPEANLSFAQVAEAFRDEFFHRLQVSLAHAPVLAPGCAEPRLT